MYANLSLPSWGLRANSTGQGVAQCDRQESHVDAQRACISAIISWQGSNPDSRAQAARACTAFAGCGLVLARRLTEICESVN
jgi:hypothetical protein